MNGKNIADLGYVAENKALKTDGHWPHAMKHPISACRVYSVYSEGLFSHLSILVCVG